MKSNIFDYLNSESEFFNFLTDVEVLNKNTRTNFISWLRFLSQYHKIDNTIDENVIKNIIDVESINKNERNYYSKDKDISNFKSALNKYLKFVKEDFYTKSSIDVDTEIKEINNSDIFTITEKQNLTLSRIGQGKFRNQLIEYWSGCSITKLDKLNLLVASHIKPWKKSDNFERLDVYNGLLLLPNYDKLFDKGYINFDNKGKIKISSFLEDKDLKILNISPEVKLINIESKHIEYLEYHREHCFIG